MRKTSAVLLFAMAGSLCSCSKYGDSVSKSKTTYSTEAGTVPVSNGESQVPGGNTGDAGPAVSLKYSDEQVLELIEKDVSKLNPTEQPKVRYFTLHVAAQVPNSAAVMKNQRLAFLKTLNSLSVKPALAKPTALDRDLLVYRLNLDDIGMSPAQFDAVIADHYPFAFRFQDTGSSGSIDAEATDDSLRKLLGTDIYMIRMDWWNATATLPILYKKFMAFPDNLSDFEDQFLGRRVSLNGRQVDLRLANIINNDVIRTGFDNSKVAFANRIVERHEGKAGGYYISYDFQNLQLQDDHNINKTPLGPRGTNNGRLEFNHDTSGVMFALQNGLFGYFLADGRGQALDKEPINISRQDSAPTQFSLAIVNGQSCMSCHNAGLVYQEDTVLRGIGTNKSDLLQADLSRINEIYQPDLQRSKMEADNAEYFAALKEMGIDPTKPDPVESTYRFYNRPMAKGDVLAELAIADRDFELLLTDPQFSGTFNPLNSEGGVMNRAVFQAIFPEVVKRFRQEVAIVPPKAADFVVTGDCMAVDLVKMDACVIGPVQ